jgi:uncharacterized protein YndB with AHSA1/START domain
MDLDQHLGAVRRRVGRRNPDTRVVAVSRTYDAPVDAVWAACTEPDRIRRWFLPITGELRQGGRYQLEGNAGGVVQRCDPPRSFAATWEHGDDVSTVEVGFVPTPEGGTVLTLEHVGHTDDAFWEQYGPGAVGIGWESALLGLAGHLGAGGVPTPGEAAAWSASEEGRTFTTRSGAAWCAAHVASGADPEAARAAAGRTVAAYTGVPETA